MKTTHSSTIPIIDIGAWTSNNDTDADKKQQVVLQIKSACEEIGFFAITNHGVNNTTLDRAWNAAKRFFEMPIEEKMKWKTDNEEEYPYGYEQSERLSVGKDGAPVPCDLKETFALGPNNPESGMPPRRFLKNHQPDDDFASALSDYYTEMEGLALQLLTIFAKALDLPADFFDSRMTHHMSALRILNYFNLDQTPPPGALRASAHTDYGVLTILKSGGPGLQVKKDVDGLEWVDVPMLDDAFIINIGDLMQRWTNDKWVSTLHRVVLPPLDGNDHQRQSMAFFCNVNGDTIVTPFGDHAKYPPISAKDHLMAKHLASMGVKTPNLSDEL